MGCTGPSHTKLLISLLPNPLIWLKNFLPYFPYLTKDYRKPTTIDSIKAKVAQEIIMAIELIDVAVVVVVAVVTKITVVVVRDKTLLNSATALVKYMLVTSLN